MWSWKGELKVQPLSLSGPDFYIKTRVVSRHCFGCEHSCFLPFLAGTVRTGLEYSLDLVIWRRERRCSFLVSPSPLPNSTYLLGAELHTRANSEDSTRQHHRLPLTRGPWLFRGNACPGPVPERSPPLRAWPGGGDWVQVLGSSGGGRLPEPAYLGLDAALGRSNAVPGASANGESGPRGHAPPSMTSRRRSGRAGAWAPAPWRRLGALSWAVCRLLLRQVLCLSLPSPSAPWLS